MNAYKYMRKHLRNLVDGFGWPLTVFRASSSPYQPVLLVDVAVDIAWEQLGRSKTERPDLDITMRNGMIYFSRNGTTL